VEGYSGLEGQCFGNQSSQSLSSRIVTHSVRIWPPDFEKLQSDDISGSSIGELDARLSSASCQKAGSELISATIHKGSSKSNASD
jgi:hypothetical protein